MSLMLAALLVLAAGTPLLTRGLGRNAGYPLAAVFAGMAATLGAWAPAVLDGRTLREEIAWAPGVGVNLVFTLDGLSLLFGLLILGIGAVVFAYSARYLQGEGTRMYTLLVLFATSMLGLVLSGDVILLVVFWELTSITSFLLIGGRGDAGADPARRALLVTSLGGLALLGGMVLLSVAAGTSDLGAIVADPSVVAAHPARWAIFALVCAGAFTKSAQFPFHFWLPGAMVAPTPVSTYLHAATMVKAGIYLLMRLTPVFAGTDAWLYVVGGTGLVTAVVTATLALKQHDLKALLAYSTVSQLGFLVALIGIGTPEALAAAAVHTIAHACYKATLFMVVGVVEAKAGSRDIRKIGGLGRSMPLVATVAALATLSMAGIPPLIGFVSKEESFAAFLGAPGANGLAPVGTAMAAVAVALTFAYGARFYAGTFGGAATLSGSGRSLASTRSFVAPAAVTAVLGGLGLFAGALDPLIGRVAADAGHEHTSHLGLWHGLTPALAISVTVIAVGALLFALRGGVERVLGALRSPLQGQASFDRVLDGLVRLGAAVGRPFVRTAPAANLAWVLATLVGTTAAFTIMNRPSSQLPPPPSLPQDWIVTVLLSIAVIGVVRSTTRLGAVALTGLIGFVVATIYVLLGAPDLALTQLLVETLTVTLVVLVFRRLPERFVAPPRMRASFSTVAAVAIGGLAAGGTYALAGRRGPSAVGEYYIGTAEAETGGKNVVNTILVDFRALDTLGEVTVLAVVALGIAGVLGARRSSGRAPGYWTRGIDTLIVNATSRVVSPAILVASMYLLIRGHNAPGGGFIAALAAGAAIVLRYVAYGNEGVRRLIPARSRTLLGAGLATCAGAGLFSLTLGATFLEGTIWRAQLPFGEIKLASSIVFDTGVYLIVIAMIVAAIRVLGGDTAPEDDSEVAGPQAPVPSGEGAAA